MAYIYIIKNRVNDKVYVGKTLNTIEERFKEHCKESARERSKNRPLYRAMLKYGTENFYIEQLEQCEDFLADEREIYWIKEYNSYGKCGYNATHGGDGKMIIPENERNEIVEMGKMNIPFTSIAHKFNRDSGTIKAILKSNCIDPTYMSEEERQASSGSYPVAAIDSKTKQIVKVFKYVGSNSEILDFLSTKDIRHIRCVCLGKRKTAYGYCWQKITMDEYEILSKKIG